MGLDMYAYTTLTALPSQVDFPEPPDAERLYVWRKHPKLHGWMEALYFRKGGKNPEFNLSAVAIDAADLDRLESDVRGNRLPETDGCFFGVSSGTETEGDLAFIGKARASVAAGRTVLYVAWW